MMFVFIVYLIWIASTIDSSWFVWLWSTFTILLDALFWCLEVKVGTDGIFLSYSFSLINKKIQRQQILQVEVVRYSWWYGLGIRLIPHGWMWNISGLDAIKLTSQDGNRFRIGTNQPQELYQALITGIC